MRTISWSTRCLLLCFLLAGTLGGATPPRAAHLGLMLLFAALGWALMGHAEGVQKNQNSRGAVRGRRPITPEPAP
jgi:hypothetical protein